ncbi:MAG: S8 family serine peptidase [Trueperaceae bacterium]|nr:S8 family serine peptidase [Trueperaceae bacterium]
MHHTVSKLLKYVGLVIGLGLLASCSNSLNGRELAPNKEVAPYYVASVKIDGSSTQAEVEQRYGGSTISFNPKAGFAVLGFSKEEGELSTLATTVNQNAYSNPEVGSSGISAWSSGFSAWAGGFSAWAGGWSAWASGETSSTPPLPQENASIFNQIKLAQAHELSHNYGQGIKVAVIDTGIDLNHPMFQGRLAPSTEWKDYVDNDSYPQEGSSSGKAYGHGTAAAGIVLQVAPLATILPIRVLGPDGQGDLDDLLLAIDWAVQKGADVINLSLGSVDYIDPLFYTVDAAMSSGVYIVAAAGNTGNTTLLHPAAGAQIIANEGKLMSIGSVTSTDSKSSFSSYGSDLEYVAPGEKILTAYPNNQVAKVTGTSFATPLYSGTLALYMSDIGNFSSRNLDSYLAGGSDYVGFSDGRLNVAKGYNYFSISSSPSSSSKTLSLQGKWTSSGGRSSSASSNPKYSFSVDQSGTVSIDLSSSIDTYLYLLNSSGQVIATDDDGGSGYNSRIQMSLSKGSYTVVAATYSSGQSGSFTVSVNGTVSNLTAK